MSLENSLEQSLKNALRRENPPAGFANRVMERAAQRRKQKIARNWMAIAAMLLVGTLAGTEVRERRSERREAEAKAGRQLVAALKIASHQLRTTQRLVRRSTNGT